MTLEILSAVIALAGLVLMVAGLRRVWRRRLWSGGSQGLAGALLLALAALLGALALNLHTYLRLTYEQPAAELRFRALGPQRYLAEVLYPSGKAQTFVLRGDDWQLDARVLKWRGLATLLGLNTAYRLERLSGRYERIDQERYDVRSVYALAHNPGMDLWSLARRYSAWLPWVDAVYGNATYLPMANGAHFEVSVTASGLVARPLNAAAREAVRRWR